MQALRACLQLLYMALSCWEAPSVISTSLMSGNHVLTSILTQNVHIAEMRVNIFMRLGIILDMPSCVPERLQPSIRMVSIFSSLKKSRSSATLTL